MLLRFVLVATLAADMFGRTTFSKFYDNYDPDYESTQLVATEYCKAIHAEDKVPEVTSSIKKFAKCMNSLLAGETMSGAIREATNTGTYDTVIRKYCPKAPQLMDCARDVVKGVTPCMPPGVAGTLISTNTLIDFFCDNDGARVTSFVKKGGPQCIQENQLGIALCQQEINSKYSNVTKATNTYRNGVADELALSEKERCSITDQVLMCMANLLKGCSSPTPGKIVQEFHDVYLESLSCPKESGVTKVVGEKVVVPQTLPASVVSEDLEQLKKQKLELEIRIAELEMWNRENQLHVQHTDLTSDIKPSL